MRRRIPGMFIGVLVVAGLVSSLGTAAIVAASAGATAEPIRCANGVAKCEAANGKENYVANTRGWNFSRNGICAAVYRHNYGSNYTLMKSKCNPNQSEVLSCIRTGEVYGHGKIEITFLGGQEIEGFQDNYKYCG